MAPEVICLDSSPIGPPPAPSWVHPPPAARGPNFDLDDIMDDILFGGAVFGDRLSPPGRPPKAPKRTAPASNYNIIFSSDDFDTTGDLSFSVDQSPPAKKPRVPLNSRPRPYSALNTSRLAPMTSRLDPIQSSSPHQPRSKNQKGSTTTDYFNDLQGGEKENRPRVEYNLLSDDDWEFDMPSSKPTKRIQPKQPVDWDPISSSFPEAPAKRASPISRSRTCGHNKSAKSTRQSDVIDLDDSSESFPSDNDDLPDLDSIKFRKANRKPLSRSKSDTPGLATSVAPKPAGAKATTKQKLTIDEREKARKEKAAAREVEKARMSEARKKAQEQRKREKEEQAALAAVNKVRIDKKETVKQMIVDLPESMTPTTLQQTQTLLREAGAEHTTWVSSAPNVVQWRRKVRARYSEKTKRFEPIPETVEVEQHILVLVTATEFVDLVQGEEGRDLDAHALKVKARFPKREVIYLIEGLTQWIRKNRSRMNREFAAKIRQQFGEPPAPSQGGGGRRRNKNNSSNASTMAVTKLDEEGIEDALLKLQVVHDVKIHHTGAAVESAQWIAIFTQHVSTIPWKRAELNMGADTGFCMDSGQVRSGEDAKGAYVRMLEEVTRITKPIAWGVVNEFENVTKLVKGLEEGGPLRLQDVPKAAGRHGEVSDRTIGQAVSRRLWKVFTSRDPESLDV